MAVGELKSRWACLLFLIPVGCSLLLMGAVDLVVTRDPGSIEKFTSGIKFEVYSAKLAATMYQYAISLSVLAVACFATLAICGYILSRQRPVLSENERRFVWIGIGASVLLPILLIFISHTTAHCGTGLTKSGIEDCLGSRLIELTIRAAYLDVFKSDVPKFVGRYDSDAITFVVLFTYFIGTLTSAVVATSEPLQPGIETSADIAERINKISVVLFAMAVVMAVVIVAMKLRFDLGLATMLPSKDGKPSPGQVTYQTLANATVTTWGWFLSIYLAMMYLPSFVAAHLRSGEFRWEVNPVPGLGIPHFVKFVKVLALFAPPLVAKTVELVSG